MEVSWLDKGKSWRDQDYGGVRAGKSVCVQRYGGFGDMLQMSSILPGLKEQGYHVTVNTTRRGYDVVKHDPNIDAFLLQDDDFVPNHELGYYWGELAKCFSKFVMLSESVEGSLIALPERREGAWHPAFRRMVMGTVDYLEATHAIAEVPLPPRVAFYPSRKEIAKAERRRKKLGSDQFIILWALSGSSVHKVYPHLDAVLARLMIGYTDVKVVTVGDELCKVLEQGWQDEPRVITRSGEWSIRETLAFAQQCDLVIGPETGVLNAVSMDHHIPKILMLSHSSSQNLGSNWKNAAIITPKNTPCYPCHLLHRGFDLCSRDEETGAALCAANIDIEDVCKHLFMRIEGIDQDEQLFSAMSKVS